MRWCDPSSLELKWILWMDDWLPDSLSNSASFLSSLKFAELKKLLMNSDHRYLGHREIVNLFILEKLNFSHCFFSYGLFNETELILSLYSVLFWYPKYDFIYFLKNVEVFNPSHLSSQPSSKPIFEVMKDAINFLSLWIIHFPAPFTE